MPTHGTHAQRGITILMVDRSGKRFVLAVTCAGILTLSACAGGATKPPPTPPRSTPAGSATSPAAPAPKQLTPVVLQLSYVMSGYFAPFVVAKEMGFYRDAGLDVTIKEGRGNAVITALVAKSNDMFGAPPLDSLPPIIDKGAAVHAVAVYVRRPQSAFIYHAPEKFQTPLDLKGKDVYSFAGSVNVVLLPVVLSKYQLKVSDINLKLVAPGAVYGLFAKDPKGVMLDFLSDDYEIAKSEAPDAREVPYYRFGLNAYDIGLVASNSMIRSNPAEVKAFVKASSEGWDYARLHPDQVGTLAAKEFKVDPALITREYRDLSPLLDTPATQGKPTGWMAASDWTEQLNILKQAGVIQSVRPLSNYYTNAFVQGS